MIKNIITIVSLCVMLTGATLNTTAQQITQAAKDSARTWVQQHQSSVDISTFQAFKQQMKPILNNMAASQVVGLGEGTHGTSEFQTVRTWITRYLCEEKGFTVVCLENSYGWCVELNKYIQTGVGNLDTLMQQNLLGMWQNAEIKELLQWMQQYNQTHSNKLQLAGIDYSETSTNARIIQAITGRLNNPALAAMVDTLLMRAHFMDAAYADMNASKPSYQWKDILDNGVKAYEVTLRIKATLDSLKPQLQQQLTGTAIQTVYTTLYNCELAYYSIYRPVKERKEASRDEAMANMVRRISEQQNSAKAVVWAHNAHLAKERIFGDESNGGGTGMYLNEYFPGNYRVIGTGTAGGTYSSTTDRFIVNTSRFKSDSLTNAINNSWEELLRSMDNKACFIDTRDKQYPLPALPLRFTGYGRSDKKDFVAGRINKLFDGFIFIPVTQATHIMQ
ncbi:erythromycin esterase family protein [Pseudoflavitalea sp. X16]|uniref:erythromycin esterase family protein n=1 Tax=Paraflavitalea devenefica TaxID=2716334 RepID=UPI00141F9715|nr:erythromycin esterase family protein [Paraflavitalea devenefica]NII25103.1 erythromycin esterase family protein [Paraflavitalea devenefica]